MSRTLVTGGAGFIGANLVRTLLEAGRDIRVFDNLSTGRDTYLADVRHDIEMRKGSVSDPRALRRAMNGVSEVIHLAALPGVPQSVAHPDRDFEVNVRGTFNTLNAARLAGVGRFVLASSAAVMAGAKPPHSEALPTLPISPYGASKVYGEAALQAFAASFDQIGVALRFSNVYGPFCSHKKSVVAAFLRRTMRGQPLIINGSGRQTRDFLHVRDVCQAVLCALAADRSGVFQLGTGVETSVRELSRLVQRVAGGSPQVERRPKQAADASRNFTDPSRARTILHWRSAVSLEAGLADTYQWILHQWPP